MVEHGSRCMIQQLQVNRMFVSRRASKTADDSSNSQPFKWVSIRLDIWQILSAQKNVSLQTRLTRCGGEEVANDVTIVPITLVANA